MILFLRVALTVGLFAIALTAGAATLPTGFTETQVATGLSAPTAMAFAPDGRLFICQQGGKLRVVKNGVLLAESFLTVPVNSNGERGLLGVTFDPAFSTNGFVYVYYTATTPAIHNRVSRFTAAGDVAVAGSEQILLELDNLSSASNHNGGAMHFGLDGKLYIAVGENATPANAQTLANLLGKMLRINKDGTIPTDNPFFATATGKNRAIWALGLRNPFTFAFQPGNGRMLINDVGQSAFEEINEGIAGANYGWPASEGPTSNPAHQGPLFWYPHGSSGGSAGCAITGGAFYNPTTGQFPPSYAGTFFFADYCNGWIRMLDPANGNAVSLFATGISSPVDLQVASDGSLWYLARGTGSVWRVEYTADQSPQITSHPVDVTVSAGQPASFSVTASGTPTLSFQWQRDAANIPGATSASYTIASATLPDNGATFRAVVSNTFGSDTSTSATLLVTSNSSPTATITTPANGTFYTAGQTVTYAGTGTDPESGNLPPSAFTWQVDFHHDAHAHPFIPATTGATSGSFVIPQSGHTEANVFYRIHLTVRDAGGLTHSTFSDLVPRTATITLASSPSGLQLTLDGQPVTTPFATLGVVGVLRTLGAVSPQTSGGSPYAFQAWSDGGAQTHEIVTPATSTTYAATYAPSTGTLGIGLQGYYFDNLDLTGATVTRLDATVDFDWATGPPVAGIGPETFSVRWTGQVLAKVSGITTFYTTSDDGVRLYVNNTLVIDHWPAHTATEDVGTIVLTAGQKYDIRMETYDDAGPAVAKLSWSGPGLAKEVVPPTHLYPYALLVVGSLTLNPGDIAVRDRLTATGFTPVVRRAQDVTPAEAAGKALVFLSATSDDAYINTKFRTTVTPVLNCARAVMDDLGMTGATDFGRTRSQTQLSIMAVGHPMAAGLSGKVNVTSIPDSFIWSVPNANALWVARPHSQTGRASIFAYERGAAMPGLPAPGRRVGFFLEERTAASLTTPGWSLFDAAMRWTTGR